jgi:thiamine-monophosphate kinase
MPVGNASNPQVRAACPILSKMRSNASKLILEVESGEVALIRRIRRRATSSNAELRLGIGDDCALMRLKPGEEVAVTTDLSIAGRHFHLGMHSPESVGHRALARGLSDIAAMGARPVAALLSLGLPRELTVSIRKRISWIDRFLDGFLALADDYETPLAGGDLAESSLAVADIVLLGAVPRGSALLRSSARAGDLVYVTGKLGGAAAGLQELEKRASKNLRWSTRPANTPQQFAPHFWPQPRIPQGLWLRRRQAATAAIDLSDGISTDLEHICIESGVSAEIDEQSLPLHEGATLDQALNGGEDYELLFTAPPDTFIPRRIAGVAVTRIGTIKRHSARKPRITLITDTGCRPLQRGGWQHFSAKKLTV